MRISTLVDTNVFIDILGSGEFLDGSLASLVDASRDGAIVLTAIVWAELAAKVEDEAELLRQLSWLRLRHEDFPFAAAHKAGRAHRLYRERGGRRERTLPDFLIGAHAAVAGHRLLTRDPARYRAYFPDLDLLAPDERP